MNIRKLTSIAVAIALLLSLLIPIPVFAQTTPTVVTGSATDITDNLATVSGNLTSLGTATTANVSVEKYVPDQIIIKFKQGIDAVNEQGLNDTLGTAVIHASPFAGFKTLRIPEGETVEEMVAQYLEQSIVEYAEPNYIHQLTWNPDDPNYSLQWHFSQINLETAWDLDTTTPNYGGDPSIIVAVIDSGVAYETNDGYVRAPDLANTNFASGWDFVNGDDHPNDDNRHGTHVTGTIAQNTNNGLGVGGIAFNTTIMPIKTFDSDGTGTTAQIADSFYYAADNGAHIINYSAGGPHSVTLENAVAYAYNSDVTIIASAGNEKLTGNAPSYPAAYDDYAIAVGATRHDQTRSYYSNTGSYLDVAAPGGDTSVDQNGDSYPDGVLQQTFAPGDVTDFAYYFLQGTSMAAPHVAGVAALILSKHPTWTATQVRQALESTATDKGAAGWDNEYGWGLINAPAAVSGLEVTTSAADNITSSSATLNGNLTNLGPATAANVSFEYGTATSYGSNTTAQTVNGTGVFSAYLTGLTANTTYHFRAKADAGVHGSANGADMTFFAGSPTSPEVTTLSVTNIAGSSATVSGNLTSLGTATTADVSFAYGMATSYGSNTTAQTVNGTGVFSAYLTGLTDNTTYYFQARADGGIHGTANGTGMSFATLTAPTVTTTSATNITINSANISGDLTDLGTATTANVSFVYGPTTSYGSNTIPEELMTIGTFSAGITGLSPGTTYHFQAKADGGIHGEGVGADNTFTTGVMPPIASTSNATNITNNTATISGNLTSLGTATTANISFEYGPTISYGITTIPREVYSTGVYSFSLTDLSPGTTYHFRVRANAGLHGSVNGSDVSFITRTAPTVDTIAATDITLNSATVNGNLTDLGTATTVDVFFWHGANTSYGGVVTAPAKTATGTFSASLIGLSSNTTYYFQAWADGRIHGTANGTGMSFATLTTPTVTTDNATDITINSANVSGNLTSLGTASTANVSFEYGLNTSYGRTTALQAVTDNGTFSAGITGLSPGTTYHFRAKADGGIHGEGAGTDMTFTTAVISPMVGTLPAANVTHSKATLKGYLVSLGTANPVEVFFKYGTTTSYGSNTTAQVMDVTGEFSTNLTGLSPETTYHFQAKADGGIHGTANGTDMAFTTDPLLPPVVNTTPVTYVTNNTTIMRGNLSSLGTGTAANVSFEYGITVTYGSTTIPEVLTAIGTFSARPTGLSSNTTYHFRAKADGGVHGSANGSDMTFTTLTPPTVTTDNATAITINSVNVSGTLTSLGTASTANASFEYGLNTSYGSNTTAQAMDVTGTFSVNLTGLSPGTTYHFRAVADSGINGMAIGADKSLTTAGVPPTVITSNATNITYNSATVSGNLTDLGTASTANVSFEYGLNTSYGSNTTAQAMDVTGTFSASLTGLSSNTTYHFRAKADGGAYGIDTGANMTFTTTIAPQPSPPSTPSSGGGGGGVPAGWTLFTDRVGDDGVFIYDVTAKSENEECILEIKHRTKGLNRYERAFNLITVFEVEEPPELPEGGSIIGTVYNIGPEGATFEPAITLTISYDPETLPEEVIEEELYIAYWDGSQWLAFESVVDTELYTVSAQISHFTEFAVISKPAVVPPSTSVSRPASFAISDLSITTAEVKPAEQIAISVLVTNTGGRRGSYPVILKINDVEEDRKEVALGAGQSETVTFTIAKDSEGSYTVNIDGKVGQFNVIVPPPPTPTPVEPLPVQPPTNWWLIGGVIAGCVVVAGLLGYFLAWRERRTLGLLFERIYTKFIDKRIVRTYTVRPLASGKHALVIEFGVRIGQIEGLHVGVSVDAEKTDFRAWLDKPNTPTVTVIKTGIIKKLAAGYRPQTQEQQVKYVKLTPAVSYYWYLEAEEPLNLKDVLLLDYYDRKP
ncbi:S8 family serine peptidase [Chloroflexota bacterium]